MNLIENSTYRIDTTVTKEKLAVNVKSGGLEVFATPAMIALIEETCYKGVQSGLDQGQTTVGTLVNVSHLSPTALGKNVYVEAKLTKIEGKKLSFEVKAFDESGEIGKGTHERFIINEERFMSKVNAK